MARRTLYLAENALWVPRLVEAKFRHTLKYDVGLVRKREPSSLFAAHATVVEEHAILSEFDLSFAG